MAQATIKEAPDYAPLLDTAGWIEHLDGHDQAALGHLNRAIQSLSSIPDVHYHLGAVYKGLGNQAWSNYHLQEAASGPANNPSVAKAKALMEN